MASPYEPGPGSLPTAPLRERFLDTGTSLSELAERLGWMTRGKPDKAKVGRCLGLLPETSSKRDPEGARLRYRRQRIDHDVAVAIGDALGLSPHEYEQTETERLQEELEEAEARADRAERDAREMGGIGVDLVREVERLRAEVREVRDDADCAWRMLEEQRATNGERRVELRELAATTPEGTIHP